MPKLDWQEGIKQYIDSERKLIQELMKLIPDYYKVKKANKYEIGDTVWRLDDEDRPHKLRVVDLDLDSDEMYLDQDDNWWVEEQLYPSKKDLIEARIEYWQHMLHAEKYPFLPPEHVQNAINYFTDGSVHTATSGECDHGSLDEGDLRKCFYCGELFR